MTSLISSKSNVIVPPGKGDDEDFDNLLRINKESSMKPRGFDGSHRRRSEPPLPSQNFDPNITRDEAYVKALAKFNQWRTSHRAESLCPDEINIPATISEEKELNRLQNDHEHDDQYGNSSDDEIADEEDYKHKQLKENLKILLANTNKNSVKKLNNTPLKYSESDEHREIVNFPVKRNNINPVDNRFSLPVGVFSKSSSSLRKKTPRKQVTRSVYKEEVREFEELHCQQILSPPYIVGSSSGAGNTMSSPPFMFYRQNIEPYPNNTHCITPIVQCNRATSPIVEYATPKKKSNAPKKPNRRFNMANIDGGADMDPTAMPVKREEFNPNAPLPKVNLRKGKKSKKNKKDMSDSEQSQFNGSYKKYELNSSSAYDDCVISSRAYKGKLKKASPLPKPHNDSIRRQSPPYQTIVNRHGELVEYALPFNENNERKMDGMDEIEEREQIEETRVNYQTPATVSALSPAKISREFLDDLNKCDLIIQENFKFLNEKYNLEGTLEDIGPTDEQKDVCTITDLDSTLDDKESDFAKGDNARTNQAIFRELDSLEKWTRNIDISPENHLLNHPPSQLLDTSHLNSTDFLTKSSNILMCWPNEIKYRTSILRSTLPSPLELTSGIFRNTSISLRKYALGTNKNIHSAEFAIKRDMKILNQIRHSEIILLMSISFDRGINQFTTIMEPVDFTLYYFIHKIDKQLSVPDCISIVQQIANATLYLQECGYIHSNISSHAVMMRRHPVCVKLSSFELATETSDEIKREIEFKYQLNARTPNKSQFNVFPEYSLPLRGSDIKEKYIKMSKQMPSIKRVVNDDITDVLPKHMPYYLKYRQQYSLHYYQAPELISTEDKFVFPNKFSDVYSLTLLLWELLNNFVPNILYSYGEIDKLNKSNLNTLPHIEPKRCEKFTRILSMGLEKRPANRQMCVQHLISLLDSIQGDDYLNTLRGVDGKKETSIFRHIMDDGHYFQERQNALNEKLNDFIPSKLDEKECFGIKNHLYENMTAIDPQKRIENAICNNISWETVRTRSSDVDANSYISMDKFLDEEKVLSPPRVVLQRTNGELSNLLSNGCTPKVKRLFESPKKLKMRFLSPKFAPKPNESLFNLSQSTIYKSISNMDKLLSPSKKEFVVYERTSTLKKKKCSDNEKIDLFENLKLSPTARRRCILDDELNMIPNDIKFSREQFLRDHGNSPQPLVREKSESSPTVIKNAIRVKNNGLVARAKAKFMKRVLNNGDAVATTTSEEDIKSETNEENTATKTPKKKSKSKNGDVQKMYNFLTKSAPSTSYGFAIGEFTLPDQPIARKNKLRRNAWLSDHKLPAAEPEKEPKLDDSFKMVCRNKSANNILDRSFRVETDIDDDLKNENIISIQKCYFNPNISTCNISLDDSMKNRKINLSVKVLHNDKEIFNNSISNISPNGVPQLKQIKLGMINHQNVSNSDMAEMTKPEINIKMKALKGGTILNEDEEKLVWQRITDLTSEIRNCFAANDGKEAIMPDLQNKIFEDLSQHIEEPIKVTCREFIQEEPERVTEKLVTKSSSINFDKEKNVILSPEMVRKYYPNMPEMLSDAIQKQRERQKESMDRFENSLWKREKSICERSSLNSSSENKSNHEDGDESFAHEWVSVRDVVKKIDSLSVSKDSTSLTNSKMMAANRNNSKKYIEANIIQLSRVPNGGSCSNSPKNKSSVFINLMKSPEGNGQPIATSSPLLLSDSNKETTNLFDSTKNSQSPLTTENSRCSPKCKMTTMVTLNMRKVRKLNDEKIEQSIYVCHSCGNKILQNGNDEGQSKTNATVNSEETITENDETSKRTIDNSDNTLKKSQTLQEARSTEDLYIDDDFREGISLAANMELLSDFLILESIDLNVLCNDKNINFQSLQ